MTGSSPHSSSVLRLGDYRRVRWKNDGGWTWEILRGQLRPDAADAHEDDWDWRLSIASIDAAAPFSAFPGVDRELVLLSGNGLRLRFDDGRTQELAPPHGRTHFAGERQAVVELVDGPARAFNLMWKRETMDAQLWHRPLVGSMVLFVDPGECWAVHLVAGQACFADGSGLGEVLPGDTAVLRAHSARARHLVEGGGELLLARVFPHRPG